MSLRSKLISGLLVVAVVFALFSLSNLLMSFQFHKLIDSIDTSLVMKLIYDKIGALVSKFYLVQIPWLVTSHVLPIGELNATRIQTLCTNACSIVQKWEAHQRMNQLGCSYIYRSNKNKKETSRISFHYCRPNNPFYSWYQQMEEKFLQDVMTSNLKFEGIVLFVIEDNSTLRHETLHELKQAGIPFLSHAHLTDAIKSNKHLFIWQPDYHFIEHDGYKVFIKRVQKLNLPFSNRSKVVFWRGSTTGHANSGTCEGVLRMQLVDRAKNISWLDVQISAYLQLCASRSNVVTYKTAEIDWILHRGIIDIDGNSNAWGLFWRLASGSVVFRVDSQFSNAYISQMKPWVHFVPLSRNLSNLLDNTRIIAEETYTKRLANIARNAYLLTTQFTYKSEVRRVTESLNMFYRLYTLPARIK